MKCVADTCPIALWARFSGKFQWEEMISRRMWMIDARRVTRSIHCWLLSHLTTLCAIAQVNTSTRADRKQYRALETLILNITFRSIANEHKKFYEHFTNYLNDLIEYMITSILQIFVWLILHLCQRYFCIWSFCCVFVFYYFFKTEFVLNISKDKNQEINQLYFH